MTVLLSVYTTVDSSATDLQIAPRCSDLPLSMSLLWFQRNPLPVDWVAQREVVARFDA